MKIQSFNYTKLNGATNYRVVAVLHEPSKALAGLDIDELDEVHQGEFAAAMNELNLDHQTKIEQLKAKYDIRKSYRVFLPERMTDITVEWI